MFKNLFGKSTTPSIRRDHRGRFATPSGGQSTLKKIRIHFESGLSLTVVDCLKLYHTTELRARVSQLRKSGMNIVGTPFTGNGKTYHVYKLVKLKTND